MSPLMQAICDDLRAYALERYIDSFERDTYAAELAQLHGALSAALPECCQALLRQYILALNARARMELEAMFQAAFAAAKELS
ncbi:MAG: hypothetical protein HFG04_06810 [Oscillibacter sp.]|jgi:LPS O-antigen subunit length determinant protein (WzzB/FepE family)|nr:hypothetical protein [Oscillibacter sp.]MCI9002894.1 hypothetical protein [Oscillibacter sp.]